jgi:Tannase and feruloyl esterase
MGSVFTAVMVAALGSHGQEAPTAACPRLEQLALPQAEVTSAKTVLAGEFTPPPGLPPWLQGDPSLFKTLPPFCRVAVRATPSADSAIEIEVWMPTSGWNGRFRGQGNGGFAGQMNVGAMGSAVRLGYATASTDTGHSGGATDAGWALGHPEKVTDYGYRGIHVMTEIAKATIAAFYGRSPQHSYFAACSNGGRQALMEVQRFPGDYDGVIAGAPAHHFTHLLTKSLADAQSSTVDPATYIPPSKLPALAKAVNAACDAQDGLTDGILGDPAACRFDPATLQCKDVDSDGCLTGPQVKTLRGLYTGPSDARGRPIYPGYVPGAEEGPGGWGLWITGPAAGKSLLYAFATGFFSNFVYEKSDWDYRTANIQEALAAAEKKLAPKLDATDPNLAAFKAHGGKLVLYHGWNDPAISAWSTVEYYDSVVSRLGRPETDAFVRLYMVPGMQHCSDGPGPHAFGLGSKPPDDPRRNVYLALEQWVEKGAAPSAIVATKYVNDDPAKGAQATRPLCPHPQIAKYKGSGDPSDAASFECGVPRP